MDTTQYKLDVLANQRNQAMDQVVHLTALNAELSQRLMEAQAEINRLSTESSAVLQTAELQPAATVDTDQTSSNGPLASLSDLGQARSPLTD